jgi:hypothetical protein
MGPWCFDLNDTISSTPALMKSLMKGLRDAGHEVHVLSGTHHDPATQADVAEKHDLLKKLGFEHGVDYDKLIAVSGPEKNVAQRKVDYMRHVKAAGLVDDRKRNIQAARKAGFLGLRHYDPKGKKRG